MRSSGENNHCNRPIRVDDCDHEAQQSDCPNDNSEDISRVQIAPPAQTSASDSNSSKKRIAANASLRYRPGVASEERLLLGVLKEPQVPERSIGSSMPTPHFGHPIGRPLKIEAPRTIRSAWQRGHRNPKATVATRESPNTYNTPLRKLWVCSVACQTRPSAKTKAKPHMANQYRRINTCLIVIRGHISFAIIYRRSRARTFASRIRTCISSRRNRRPRIQRLQEPPSQQSGFLTSRKANRNKCTWELRT
jgi:hypothetical protein